MLRNVPSRPALVCMFSGVARTDPVAGDPGAAGITSSAKCWCASIRNFSKEVMTGAGRGARRLEVKNQFSVVSCQFSVRAGDRWTFLKTDN